MYLGRESDLKNSESKAFIAIGENSIRKSIFRKNKNEFKFSKIVHSTAIIATNSLIQKGLL